VAHVVTSTSQIRARQPTLRTADEQLREKGAYSQKLDYFGGSQIVDPYGKVVAYAADEESVLTHTADLDDAVLKSRTEGFFGLNLLQDRRPEHYSPLVDQTYRRVPTP
jgi:predicted amidohydrolase